MTSDYIGVQKHGHRYRARILYNARWLCLGAFDSEIDAAIERDTFVKNYSLDSELNFPNQAVDTSP